MRFPRDPVPTSAGTLESALRALWDEPVTPIEPYAADHGSLHALSGPSDDLWPRPRPRQLCARPANDLQTPDRTGLPRPLR